MSIKNDGHYFCRAGGNRPDGLNEPVTISPGDIPYFCGISVIFMSVIYTSTRRKLLSIVRR
ncbi:hypothetical protein FCY75_23950 [Escherichia coli]|nr:hypothetical protein [Escherichia coli]